LNNGRVLKIFRSLGPYPYNPKLIFAFFFAFYFSRFVPVAIDQPQGLARTIFGGVVFILAAIPSLLFAGSAYLVQRYRTWSSSNFIYYVIEVAFSESLIFICNPIFQKVLGSYSSQHFQAPATLTPGLFFGALLIALIALALLHNVERAISERLVEADELVKRLESDREELVKSDEELRRQTSQFLHDRVQSDLMVVAMKLKSIQGRADSEVNEVIAKSIARLENTRTADLRNLVQILTPNLNGGGLTHALQVLANQYTSNFHVDLMADPEIDSLSENQQLGIFRISEQALLNCLVHGPAMSVYIKITTNSSRMVSLLISDDGPGTNLSEASPGVGTAVIDSWVSILKGSRKMISRPGAGYTLEVEFPIS
jgi:signal transduction histidine kinase